MKAYSGSREKSPKEPPSQRKESFWRAQRRRVMLARGVAQLNAGTLSPTPKPVLAAVTQLRRMQASAPSDFLWRQTPRLLKRSRAALASFLHCPPDDLLLLPNITYGINIVVTSLRLPRGVEILMTNHEYGAMVFCWQRWAAERGWKLRQVKLPHLTEDPKEIVAAIRKAITQRTRALFFSHIASTTGLVLPAAELCELARRLGIFSVVDGAHAVGNVGVNLARIGADFYAANCHKWLMSPLGCGFLHVRRERKAMLLPLVTSWGWGNREKRWSSLGGRFGAGWHFAMEFHGCTDRTPQMVLPEVLAFRKCLGGERAIGTRVRELSQYARERLTAIGLKEATPRDPRLSGAMTAFELPSCNPVRLREQLWRVHRIEAIVSGAAGKQFLRVSTAWFNTRAEIDRLAAALCSLGCQGACGSDAF